MDDLQAWQRSVEFSAQLYRRLPDTAREQLDALIERIMLLKRELLDLALSAGSAAVCRNCGGKCCLHGKYYVTLLDLLVYRVGAVAAVVPQFGNAPCCPYGGAQGCHLPPPLRPMTCVIFNCDLVEECMSDEACLRSAACERELRAAIVEAEQVSGFQLGRAALLSCTEQNTVNPGK